MSLGQLACCSTWALMDHGAGKESVPSTQGQHPERQTACITLAWRDADIQGGSLEVPERGVQAAGTPPPCGRPSPTELADITRNSSRSLNFFSTSSIRFRSFWKKSSGGKDQSRPSCGPCTHWHRA